MRCVSMADVSRFNTEYNCVNSKTDAAKIKRRGVNCGYTDFTSSLLVRFTPTIYPCSDQPLIQAGFWSVEGEDV